MGWCDGKLRRRVGRGRRVVGWVLVVFGVLVAGVWVTSRWCGLEVWKGRDGAGFARGVFVYWFGQMSNPAGTSLRVRTDSFSEPDRKWFWSLTSGGTFPTSGYPAGGDVWECFLARYMSYPAPLGLKTGGLWIVTWPIPVGLLGAGGLCVWWGKWVRRQHDFETWCANCGYDLTGLGDGVRCPECAGERARA